MGTVVLLACFFFIALAATCFAAAAWFDGLDDFARSL